MSNVDLRRQLLEFFQANFHKDVKLIDICRAVQQPKKVVNSVLYNLRSEGILQKVVESPPVWRVNDKLYDRYNQTPVVPDVTPYHYTLKDESVMPCITKNNNFAVLSSVENNRSDPMYVKEQLVAYHTVVSSSTSEEFCQSFNGRQITAPTFPMQNAGSSINPSVLLSKPAEAVLNILHKQKGPLSSKALCSLLGFPEHIVKMALQHLISLGLVFQDNYSMFCTVVNKSNTIPQDDIVLRIINYLKRAQTAIHTKDLVKGVGLNNKKEINPLLYKLQQKGVVTKVNESPPMWQLGEQMVNNIDKTAKQTDVNYNKREDQTFVHNGIPTCAPKEIEYTKPLTPLGGRQKYKNGVKGLLPNNLSYEESSSANESTSEVNANNAYAEPNRSHMKNGSDIPDNLMKNYQDGASIDSNASLPMTPDLINLMSSLQPPSMTKNNESCKMGSGSSKSSPSDNDTPHVNGRSMGSRNSRQNNESGNASRKAAAAAAKAAAGKLPEPNSAAHYVNDVLNSDSFAALMKNPVSALYEYGQRNHIDTKVEIVLSEGPPHNPRFKAVAYMGDEELSTAWDKTKKDARRQAAELAVRGLVANGGFGKFSSLATSPETVNELPPVVSQFDMIAALSHKTFNERVLQVPEYMGGRKVLAALVMKKGDSDCRGTVICLGTGNRCITGEGLSQDGLVVNDSHAEVITRRGFLRFLYKQLKTYEHGKDHGVFQPAEDGRLEIRQDVSFHLYISTAPCGDGALFTHNLKPGEKVEPPDDNDSQHHPVFTKSLQGLLRSKMEAGEGTIPIDTEYRFQSWDAILRGEKLRTMSCSDKIARWNVLGLQGALLSHIMKPVYLQSVTLGNLYHHGHLSRAVCCRLVGEPELNELLPEGYRLNHPDLGRVIVCTPSRETEKTKPHSINWCHEDERPELTSGVNGTSDERAGGQLQSRLCKAVLFQSFKEIATKFGVEHLSNLTYGEAKRGAKDFQVAKEVLFNRFQQLGRGTWIRKPEEEEEFM
ncbi:Double-stranded RNA-specific adenosine deaminase [Araneus ventricosus]|uniref:Double-stranded RNA-specific adenosine deaminase n=1 Tax=Araneus ventricosus TaxID=182803 RepID=A0A4Y2FJB9_ARAVE|nr:Double-stranded RNA-specific adenosine deaminase [Araneus ventricosus]